MGNRPPSLSAVKRSFEEGGTMRIKIRRRKDHTLFFLVAQQVEIVCLSRKMLVVTAKNSKRYFFIVFRYFSYKEVFYSLRLTDKW